uniref:Erythrocyte membrane protein band 4.1 like 2 n=1 Tax=Gadus morhua TaxID=8049 RepID=A0A8C5AZM6_GADMO
MTTEVGSETEVKEKAEETATQPDQPEKATEDNQEVANSENATAEGGEEEVEVVVEEEEDKKEKDGKGISRFLPPWLKKQKSQGQVVANETSPTNKVISEATEEEEAPAPAPETNGHIEEVEEKEEVQSEEVKQKEAESTSNASADTQPATEEKVTESTAQSPGEAKSATEDVKEEEQQQQQKKNEVEGKSIEPAATGDGKGTADEGLSSIFQSPLRLVRRNKMKLVVCHVALLDGTDFPCEVEKRAKGQFLFFKVYEHLNLMERDYFGLTYKDSHEQRCWLDPTKDIKRQIRSNNWQFSFNVKFYPPDPSLLTEDITRYLLCLQLREDVASGRLPCSFVTHALLGSYTLQAEHGDYEPDQPQPLDYITKQSFAPNQNKEMEEKILELHKSHRGMNPAQADTQFLENAKKLSMYGVDLHRAKDSEGVDIMLGVCANGLLVYKDKLRINRFAWPKILKISYKRNNYYIKIRPGESEQFESTVGFKLPNHRSAKRLWKVCVENHSFFRLNSPEVPPKARFLTLGSKFRYSGRTQTQTRLASSLIDRPAPNFERTSSKRISRSLDGGIAPSRKHQQRHARARNRDHDKTQEDVLRHQASISQLKRSFMEAPPPSPPQPNQWEKRFSSSPAATLRAQHHPPEQPAVGLDVVWLVLSDLAAWRRPVDDVDHWATRQGEREHSDEEAEYQPNLPSPISHTLIPEEKEEEVEEVEREEQGEQEKGVEPAPITKETAPHPIEASQSAQDVERENGAEEEKGETDDSTEDPMMTPDEVPNAHLCTWVSCHNPPARVHSGGSLTSPTWPLSPPQPPVVKTEMVTISDTFAAQKTHITTKEVPIVHTETKTITYEAAQVHDAYTVARPIQPRIFSMSMCTCLPQTLKGGLSETRIEKRIVITGDSDIDHDQALAQAIKEAKEQHPDMSVTRVVVHKETELAEEDE